MSKSKWSTAKPNGRTVLTAPTAAASSVTTATTGASPTQLHYDSEGDGPLVVLLHGFPEYRISWKRQLPALARAGYRAVAPDLRGYGNSPKPRGIKHYAMRDVATDVAELIESLGGKCMLVGHDWGAAVAWGLAATRPELISKLVILNVPHPAAIRREAIRSFRQKINLTYQLFFQLPLLPELTMRLLGRRFLRRAARFTEEEIETYAKQWRGNLTPMLNYYRAMRKSRGEVRHAFKRIDIPTLIIWGEREPVFLPSALENMDEWVSDVRIERIPGIAHFVQHDAADRVNQLLLEFFSTPPTAR